VTDEHEDLAIGPGGELIVVQSRCGLCGNPVDKNDPTTWKQVKGWVGGPRKDSMRLREDTGYYAHNDCVAKLQAGQAIDQESMFEEVQDAGQPHIVTDDELPEDLRPDRD
jgi:hypothetical protein